MSIRRKVGVKYLLSCTIDDLVSTIASMSDKDCEKYAREILAYVGGPAFEDYLARIIETMMPNDGSAPPMSSDAYYLSVRDMFPHIPPESDALGRLCALVMQMCVLHMQAGQHEN